MRVLLTLLLLLPLLASGTAVAWAQASLVGVMGLTSPEQAAATRVWDSFRQGLTDLGHVEGRTFVLEYRWARGDNERFPALARELLDRRPAVIVSPCGPALRAIRDISRSVPVVANCADPRNFLGEVAALRRPGGQTTGFTFLAPESAGKRLQFLKELLPDLSRVAVLHRAGDDWSNYWQEMGPAAMRLSITLLKTPVERPVDVEAAIAAAVHWKAGALIVFPDAVTLGARERIAALAIQHRLPTAFDLREFVVSGGLFSYGADLRDLFRRVGASYVDRILKGTPAAELPVQQPTQFELIVNLRTAGAIGLSVPKPFLARADEVLQ